MNYHIIIVTIVAIFLAGCVSQSKYDEAIDTGQTLELQVERQMTEIAALTEQNELLSEKVSELTQDRSMLVSEKASVEAMLKAREDALSAKIDELRSTFSQELDENSVRIERLKNDIRVDLSDDILYASGRADLTGKGREVIKKVASQLANSPYLIRIIGNTDNVAITSRLAERFPTNWDLAAARAVGVVRLLQDEGVNPEKIEAVSRGEYYPVESNDTAEGRGKNRRTEILLRVQ
jgi:chemotaxis protein MotB